MGLYKRGNMWWVSYTADGKLIRESTGQTNKKKAEEVWVNVKSGLISGTHVPKEHREVRLPHPFETVVESYLQDRERRGKRTDSYKKLTADWLKAFTGRDVREITLEAVESRLAKWTDERAWRPCTYNNALGQISGLLSFAYRKGWIDRHPLKGRAEPMRTGEGCQRWLRPEELQALAEACPAWLQDIVIVAPLVGLRVSAFCDLRRASVERVGEDLYLVVARDKNGDPVRRRVLGLAREIVDRRLKATQFPGDYLFPAPNGGNASRYIRRDLPEAVEAAGMEWGRYKRAENGSYLLDGDGRKVLNPRGVTFHSFRHSMASNAALAGVPDRTIARMGNWKTLSMVERYRHLADEELRDAEDRLAAALVHNTSQPGAGAPRKAPVAAVPGRMPGS